MKKNLIKICKSVMTMLLAALLVLSPAVVHAEEAPEEQTEADSGLGELVCVEDLGDGWVAYHYVSYDEAQPYSSSRNATRTVRFDHDGEYVFTVVQEVSFTYGHPDGYARITSARGYISDRSSSSSYEPGTLSTSYDSSSTSTYVYSSTGIYRKSDGTKVKAAGTILYCKNDGTIQ